MPRTPRERRSDARRAVSDRRAAPRRAPEDRRTQLIPVPEDRAGTETGKVLYDGSAHDEG